MKVSVLMITYNHERFIAQAIESVLMQQTSFDYELVIGEDCSTDNTRKIVLAYAERYPDKIRPLLREHNLGANRNLVSTFEACRGDYVALLEGDDYWTSTDKLQKQVEFLEGHLECSLCFHKVSVVTDDGSAPEQQFLPAQAKALSTIEDILRTNFVPTASVVFRHCAVTEFPEWFFSLAMGDWPLFVFCAQKGGIGYIDEAMGRYRVHSGGVWSTLDPLTQSRRIHSFYELIVGCLGTEYAETTTQACIGGFLAVTRKAYSDGRIDDAKAALAEAIRVHPSLLGNEGDRLLERFAAWVEQSSRPDAISLINRVFDNLPESVSALRTRKREVLALWSMGKFYRAHKDRDWGTVRWTYPWAVSLDPKWALNRGAIVVWLGSIIGYRQVAFVRDLARRSGVLISG